METFNDFVQWCGGTRRAALQLNTSAATVSRMKNGKQRLTPEIAQAVEAVTHGLFRKERVLWPAEPKPSREVSA